MEATPKSRPGRANTALCLAIASILDELGSSQASNSQNEGSGPDGTRTHSVSVNGKLYEIMDLEFPEYAEVLSVLSRRDELHESGVDGEELPTIDPSLERLVLFRIDQALEFLDE